MAETEALSYAILILMFLHSVVFQVFFADVHIQPYRRDDATLAFPHSPMELSPKKMTAAIFLVSPILLCLFNYYIIGKDTENLFIIFMFGLLVTTEICQFFKITVGRPRPNFLALNKIEYDVNDHQLHYLTFKEAKVDKYTFIASRGSFFSGHAACSLYVGVFFILYSNAIYDKKNYLTQIGQLLFLLVGCYPGVTQYRNYWHHWTDVFTGYVVGTVIAFLSFSNYA
ncbi:Phospholipid phosphatase 3 [Halotydeus destructor]|nr:Phospholipid phosphatase 3 [Halotydeus destructor]